MLTQCPACETVYRIEQRHLEAAAGYVTCGECDHVFDARPRLAEEPRTADGKALDLSTVPAVLREDLVGLSQHPTPWQGLWWAIIVIALLGLAAQSAWYTREHWYGRVPLLAQTTRSLCALLHCQSQLPRRAGEFQLVAREIRAHPHQQGALLVNALFINRAPHLADYPILQIRLEDANGLLAGVRRFEPQEYLEHGVDIAAGVDADAKVHVLLEVMEPVGGARNFEISFL
jgi:predicted Zn finger-like uncharacterized protein